MRGAEGTETAGVDGDAGHANAGADAGGEGGEAGSAGELNLPLTPAETITDQAWTSAQIGALGGSLRLGNAWLWIPAGALGEETLIQIGVTPADPSDLEITAETYELEPDGLTFDQPALLAIHRTLEPSGASAEDLAVATWTSAELGWVEVASTWSPNGDVTAAISHFSKWGTKKGSATPRGGRCGPKPRNDCNYQCDPRTRKWVPQRPDQNACGTRSCFDLSSDPKHCGSCDNQCVAGEICAHGSCKCCSGTLGSNSSACLVEDACTDGVDPDTCECICKKDVMNDPANCGACDVRCPSGDECIQGKCTCNGKDKLTDPENCGRCDHHCAPGESCIAGNCGQCPGNPDFMTNVDHCGKCDNPCATGQACCGGNCKDLKNDAQNCGQCGQPCNAPGNCTDGECLCTIAGDWADVCWTWHFEKGVVHAECETDSTCNGTYTLDEKGYHFFLACGPLVPNGSPSHTSKGDCNASCTTLSCKYTYTLNDGSSGEATWTGSRK